MKNILLIGKEILEDDFVLFDDSENYTLPSFNKYFIIPHYKSKVINHVSFEIKLNEYKRPKNLKIHLEMRIIILECILTYFFISEVI